MGLAGGFSRLAKGIFQFYIKEIVVAGCGGKSTDGESQNLGFCLNSVIITQPVSLEKFYLSVSSS